MLTKATRRIRPNRSRIASQLECLEPRVLLSTAPSSPTLTSVTPLSPTSVQISWFLNSSNETGVAVKKWSGVAWLNLATLPAHTTAFVETGLTPNTTYFYTVSAFNSFGESWAATYLPATTPVLLPPATPSGVSAHTISATSIQVNWTLNDSADDGVYVVRWNGSTWAIISTLPGGSQAFVDTGLTPGVTYYYDVVAFNAGGATWATNYDGALTLGAPAAPTNLSAVTLNSSAIQVNWTLHGDETSVYIERWNGASWVAITQLSAGTTTFIDTGLASHTIYYYEVVAANDFGFTWAATFTSAATSTPMPPAAPSSLSAATINSSTIQVNWTLGDLSDTSVYVAKWNGLQWQIVAVLAGGSTVYFDTFANLGINYYEVISVNPFGSTWASFYATGVL